MEIARVPTISTLTLTTAGTEYSQVLVTDDQPMIKKLMIKSRTSNDLKIAWGSGGDYFTLPAGQTYWEDEIHGWALTVYLTGTVNGQVAEIQVWK